MFVWSPQILSYARASESLALETRARLNNISQCCCSTNFESPNLKLYREHVSACCRPFTPKQQAEDKAEPRLKRRPKGNAAKAKAKSKASKAKEEPKTSPEGRGVTYDHRMRSLTTTDTCQGFWVTYDHKVRSLTTTEPHIH